jgi:hypothetical protein
MQQLRSLDIQLQNLKTAFDEAIMHGSSFSEVKKIYIQIKEVEELIDKRRQALASAKQ